MAGSGSTSRQPKSDFAKRARRIGDLLPGAAANWWTRPFPAGRDRQLSRTSPCRAHAFAPVPSFTRQAIADWARNNLLPTCDVLSDGLNCFAGVIDADCAHTYMVVGNRKPRELPQFKWVNTVLGNLKTMVHGSYKAFDFHKYASHYLGAFAYRFDRRFDLGAMLQRLIGHAAATSD
jgi:hypothetical protein